MPVFSSLKTMEKSSARGNSGSSPSSGGYNIGGTPDEKRLKGIPAIQRTGLRELKIDYINYNFRNTIIFLSRGKTNFILSGRMICDNIHHS
jgi:hypothetical protein